ncbi:nitronate monooxygenase [Pseudonocardia nigra]|uniref:nitronate monooxygenase n=1 Tax=Pseudonocardia nigra TaxID=1921578 RepID=UPI001C5D0FF6|nr:nitronate monooxygenase [Pseudonocardia nigra]
MISTSFTQLVGCEVPIQQAPMGMISPPGLALAVAGAGGVGTVSVPLGAGPADLAARLDRLTDDGAGALAANFITADVDPAAVAVAGERVRIVDFFWSRPDAALVAAAHAGGALVNWQVGSTPEAVLAVEAGADVVTVQGVEAGGHVRGDTPLLPLLAAVLSAVDVPVLAAGGIAEPRALAAVLAAGAAGARLGTRFIASTETGVHTPSTCLRCSPPARTAPRSPTASRSVRCAPHCRGPGSCARPWRRSPGSRATPSARSSPTAWRPPCRCVPGCRRTRTCAATSTPWRSTPAAAFR